MYILLFSLLLVSSYSNSSEPEVTKNYYSAERTYPVYANFLNFLAQAPQPFHTLSVAEARAVVEHGFKRATENLTPVRAIIAAEAINEKDQAVIPLTIYIPDNLDNTEQDTKKLLPVITFFHGGGWVLGSVEGAQELCRRLAQYTFSIVVSVDYRLAPENPFPVPLEDCYYATKWVAHNIHQYGGDSHKLVVAGESAGGNLATTVTLKARDENLSFIKAQLLIYPALDSHIDDKIYSTFLDQHFITADCMRWYWNHYAQQTSLNTGYLSPVYAESLTHLPPALIVTAEHDPLKVEAEHYAYLLEKAGVSVWYKEYARMIHLFLNLPFDVQEAVDATKEIAGQLRSLFATEETKFVRCIEDQCNGYEN